MANIFPNVNVKRGDTVASVAFGKSIANERDEEKLAISQKVSIHCTEGIHCAQFKEKKPGIVALVAIRSR